MCSSLLTLAATNMYSLAVTCGVEYPPVINSKALAQSCPTSLQEVEQIHGGQDHENCGREAR